MSERAFDLGDVLSITTGSLLSTRHIEGVYDILNYLTGDSLFTHQLPRAAEFAAPLILDRYPELASVTVPPFDGEAEVWTWLDAAKREYGPTRSLTPFEGWGHQDAIEELCDMVGPEKVYVVTPDGEPA